MVKIVQLLCPKRHCLVAACYEEERSSFAETCEVLKGMVGPKGPFNNWCAICGSFELHFEEGATKFKTLEEAAPFITKTAADNMTTRAFLDAQGLTFEKRQKN